MFVNSFVIIFPQHISLSLLCLEIVLCLHFPVNIFQSRAEACLPSFWRAILPHRGRTDRVRAPQQAIALPLASPLPSLGAPRHRPCRTPPRPRRPRHRPPFYKCLGLVIDFDEVRADLPLWQTLAFARASSALLGSVVPPASKKSLAPLLQPSIILLGRPWTVFTESRPTQPKCPTKYHCLYSRIPDRQIQSPFHFRHFPNSQLPISLSLSPFPNPSPRWRRWSAGWRGGKRGLGEWAADRAWAGRVMEHRAQAPGGRAVRRGWLRGMVRDDAGAVRRQGERLSMKRERLYSQAPSDAVGCSSVP